MLKILDCTLRDGGYYNNWDFDRELVADYIAAMVAARPDVVEIGFRFLGGSRYLGPFAYSPESVLEGLELPTTIKMAVMVNEADFPRDADAQKRALESAFLPCAESRVDMVRVATTRARLDSAAALVANLKQLGYTVALNVMQIAGASDEELAKIARVAEGAAPDVLYFADSTGSLRPADIEWIVSGLRAGWSGALGIHAHDNMQLALPNCKAAAATGVEWVDGTVLGMGRGPGNARTEHLLLAFEDGRPPESDIAPLLACIDGWFEPLRNQHRWGSNPYYYLAGKHGIHPTYIQTMLSDSRYGAEDILATIKYLRDKGANRYSQANLEAAGNFYGAIPEGSWQPASLIENRDILVLGSGPGCANHRQAIEQFIQKHQPVVVALNVNSPIADELIDLHVACHPIRLLRDAPRYASMRCTLVTPRSVLPSNVQRGLDSVDCHDYGLALGSNGFEFGPSHAVLPRPMAAAYAMAMANSGRARHIYMAGFDGYGPEDLRNLEMNDVLAEYEAAENVISLSAITPTRYGIPEDSVYRLAASRVEHAERSPK